MAGQWWSWALGLIGCAMFFLAGSKVWWCWYIGLGLQALWAAYAVVTEQWGFLATVPVYGFVYARNAVKWTREHREERKAAMFPYLGGSHTR